MRFVVASSLRRFLTTPRKILSRGAVTLMQPSSLSRSLVRAFIAALMLSMNYFMFEQRVQISIQQKKARETTLTICLT